MSEPQPPLRAVLVDDEPLARDNVRLVLKDEAVEWLAEAGTGAAAVAAIHEHDPDLVVLDIELPDFDGFEVLGRLPDDRRPAVIFVTAFREHAVEAFEVHAVDYVVKPFREDRLRDAVRRARARRDRGEADAVWARLETLVGHLDDAGEAAAGKDAQSATHTASAGRPAADEPPARRILVGDRDRRRFVSVDEVAWLEADGNYVRVHAAGETHLVRATLSGLARRLDPRAFVRVHRGTVVNLDRVREIQPWFAGRYLAILDDGTELRVSRSYREELLRLTR